MEVQSLSLIVEIKIRRICLSMGHIVSFQAKPGIFLIQMNASVIAQCHFEKIYQKYDNKMELTADFDQVSFI